MNDFDSYFYQVFPQELAIFLMKHPGPRGRNRCQVPLQRRALISEVRPSGVTNHLEGQSDEFCFSWYAITLMDQGLHSYFPASYDQWVRNTGGYPVPVFSYFGEVRTAAPHSILDWREESVVRWRGFCQGYLSEMTRKLEAMSGVSPKQFFEAVIRDREFDHRENLFDEVLIEAAVSAFGIEGVFEEL